MKKKKWKFLSPIYIGMIWIILIGFIILFLPPIYGVSDNGIYDGILKSNGLAFLDKGNAYYTDFVPQYKILQYYNPNQYHAFSLQNLFIQIAILLNRIFFSKTIFDIRFLAIIYFILYLFGVYILLRALTKNVTRRQAYILSLLTIFLIGDTNYMVYFNSFYPQALVYILLIYFVGLSIIAYQQTSLRKLSIIFTAQLVVTISFSLVAPGTDVFSIASFVTLWSVLLYVKRSMVKRSVLIAIVGTIPIIILGVCLVGNPYQNKDMYNSVSLGVLMENKDPAKSLQELGIAPEYEMIRGTHYDQPYTLVKTHSEMVKKNLTEKLNQWKITWFCFTHPKVMRLLLNDAIESLSVGDNNNIHADNMKKENFISIFLKGIMVIGTLIKGAFLPKKILFYLLCAISIISIYFLVAIRGIKLGSTIYFGRFLRQLGLVLVLLGAFIMPIVTGGLANISEQMILASSAIDLLIVVFISDYFRHNLWISKEELQVHQLEEEQ